MDETRIWNVARSQAQIQASMNSELGIPPTGLVGRWAMNEGTGTASTADSAGTNLGTMVASPTWVAGAPLLDPPAPGANASLAFNGINQYATMGNTSALGASQFTLEGWINRSGAGATTSTGATGLENANAAVPIISRVVPKATARIWT